MLKKSEWYPSEFPGFRLEFVVHKSGLSTAFIYRDEEVIARSEKPFTLEEHMIRASAYIRKILAEEKSHATAENKIA